MNRRVAFLSLRIVLCLSVLVGIPASGSAQSSRGTPVAPSLAKARLAEAVAAAKKWRADAILIQISGYGIGSDGLRVIWDYGYWSAAAKTCLIVNIAPGNPPHTRESGGTMCEEAELKQPFIDSDQAMKAARTGGVSAPTATMVLSNAPSKQGPRAIWIVMDGRGTAPGNAMVDIDAVTGMVLGKRMQR